MQTMKELHKRVLLTVGNLPYKLSKHTHTQKKSKELHNKGAFVFIYMFAWRV